MNTTPENSSISFDSLRHEFEDGLIASADEAQISARLAMLANTRIENDGVKHQAFVMAIALSQRRMEITLQKLDKSNTKTQCKVTALTVVGIFLAAIEAWPIIASWL